MRYSDEFHFVPPFCDCETSRDLNGASFGAKIDAIAERMAQKQMELFFRKHLQASAELGDAFDAEGAPIVKVIEGWQRNPAFPRYEELLNRKRDDWRNRESNRKLAD
jgi:hypothetical protein